MGLNEVDCFENAQVHSESHDEYHARDSKSASKVKDYINSPRGYFRNHVLKRGKKVTSAMELGTAVHEELLLEAWQRSYVVIPQEVLTSNNARRGNAWDAFKKANQGRVLLKADEVQDIEMMLFAVSSHPLASQLLDPEGLKLTEISITAEANTIVNTELGILPQKVEVRSRIDFLSNRLADIKTTGDLSPNAMRYRPRDGGWAIQAQFYRNMVHALRGEWYEFDFIVVENKEPFRVEVWTPTEDALAKAQKDIDAALQGIAQSESDFAVYGDPNIWQRAGFDQRTFFE